MINCLSFFQGSKSPRGSPVKCEGGMTSIWGKNAASSFDLSDDYVNDYLKVRAPAIYVYCIFIKVTPPPLPFCIIS